MSRQLKLRWGPRKHTKRSKAKNNLTTPWLKKERPWPKSKQTPRVVPRLGIGSLTGKITSHSVQSRPNLLRHSLLLSQSKLPQRTTKVTRAPYWTARLLGCLRKATLIGNTRLSTKTWSSILHHPPRNSRRGRKKPNVPPEIITGNSPGMNLLKRLLALMTLLRSREETKNGARLERALAGPKEPYILRNRRRLMIKIWLGASKKFAMSTTKICMFSRLIKLLYHQSL